MARYNQDGLNVLLTNRLGRGRKLKVLLAEHERLKARIKAGPTPGDGVDASHGPDNQRIIRDQLGVELSTTSTYALIERLGLSSLMPGPTHCKADPVVQEAFEKGLPSDSTPSLKPTRTAASRSGSPTRPDSASKGR